jgi:excisionase family DNA binding protein
MSIQKRVRLNEEPGGETQAASAGQNEAGLLQYYLNLPLNERSMQFVAVARAAHLIGISPRTIQRWAKQRRIRAIFVAERYQIEIKSLYNYIEQRAWARGN